MLPYAVSSVSRSGSLSDSNREIIMTSLSIASMDNAVAVKEDSATEPSASQEGPRPTTLRVILLAIVLTFANVLNSLGNSGIQVLLDSISESLGINGNNLQWISNSMQLPFVSNACADYQNYSQFFVVLDSRSGLLRPRCGTRGRYLGKKTSVHHRDCHRSRHHPHRWIHEEPNRFLQL